MGIMKKIAFELDRATFICEGEEVYLLLPIDTEEWIREWVENNQEKALEFIFREKPFAML